MSAHDEYARAKSRLHDMEHAASGPIRVKMTRRAGGYQVGMNDKDFWIDVYEDSPLFERVLDLMRAEVELLRQAALTEARALLETEVQP